MSANLHWQYVDICLLSRVNFTLEEMAPAVPAYKHFRACLKKMYMVCEDVMKIEAEQIDLSQVPRCLHYDRVKEMVRLLLDGLFYLFVWLSPQELWKLRTSKHSQLC